ncbi:MAG TPA: four helix bundle protein [Myxococcota bacterium]|nr:four helix bundle protein [Myxococcota bacterium]
MNCIAFDLSLQIVRSLKAPLAQLTLRDGALADQVRRSASSVPLNLAEGRRRAGKDRLHSYRIAAGSADEVRAALLVAAAWDWLDGASVAEPLRLLDHLLAILWKLTH